MHPDLSLSYYLADQNPHRDSSLGITEYSIALGKALFRPGKIDIFQIVSRSSARLENASCTWEIPLRTDNLAIRILVDQFHGAFLPPRKLIHYPKGFLPFFQKPKIHVVCTLHDTIAQHYADKYPNHRSKIVQKYWINQIKHSLRQADRVISVSQHSANQLLDFCGRYHIPPPPISICYQGAKWEKRVAGDSPEKREYVITLGSLHPHKRTAQLLRFWQTFESHDPKRLTLIIVGKLDEQSAKIASACRRVSIRGFLPSDELANLIASARSLLFPSEVEGFGLPALESAYLGTPTVYVRGTAVEEVVDCRSWGFDLSDYESFENAVQSAISESPENLKKYAIALRNRFSWKATAERIIRVYRDCLS